MELSVFDVFKIGIGPSSSHTVGPMKAALRFAEMVKSSKGFDLIKRVRCDLYGSLALTGRGHATDMAIILGLSGEHPETVDPASADALAGVVRNEGTLRLLGHHAVTFRASEDVLFHQRDSLPLHPNGLRLTALAENGDTVCSEEFYSIGGGIVLTAGEAEAGMTGPSPIGSR